MREQPCPNCKTPTSQALDGLVVRATLDYYRCAECREVWWVPRAQPQPSTGLDLTVPRRISVESTT